MTTISKLFAAGILITAFFTNNIQAQNQLPNMELSNIYGEKVNISEYGKSDKITLFSFWATWCGPCKKELNNLQEVYPEWKEKYNLQIVAVSTDDQRSSPKVRPYVEGQGWEYDVLLDVNEELKRQLNFQSVPHTVLVNQKGEIVSQHDGYVEGDEYEILEKELIKLTTPAAQDSEKVEDRK